PPWGGGAGFSASDGAPALVSDATDWGEGGTDNLPEDVFVDGESFDYGVDATFTCTRAGCAP
ncbi:MAG: hypothetical protein ABMA64_31615, partial [Myxococcota bacterium]